MKITIDNLFKNILRPYYRNYKSSSARRQAQLCQCLARISRRRVDTNNQQGDLSHRLRKYVQCIIIPLGKRLEPEAID